MTLYRFQDQVTDEHLHAIPNCEIWVFEADSAGFTAALTDDSGVALTQPIRTDADGIFYYNAAGGLYENHVHFGGQLRYVQQVTLGATGTSDAAYGPSWDGDTTSPPSKNAVYDEMELRLPGRRMTIYPNWFQADVENGLTIPAADGSGSELDLQAPTNADDIGALLMQSADSSTYFQIFQYGPLPSRQILLKSTHPCWFSFPPQFPDEAYGPGWNGKLEAPTKNAVFDKIETLGAGAGVDDTAYGPSWNGVTAIAPSKNAVYDKIEALVVSGGGATDDTPYGPGWNGVTTVSPSQNAVYDQMELRLPVSPDAFYGGTSRRFAGTAFAVGDAAVTSAIRLYAENPGNWSAGLEMERASGGGLFWIDAPLGTAPSPIRFHSGGTLTSFSFDNDIKVDGGANGITTLAKPTASICGLVGGDAASGGWWMQGPAPAGGHANIGCWGTVNGLDFQVTGVARMVLTATALAASVPVTVPDEAYSPAWDGKLEVPTKNAVYDKIQTLGAGGGTTTNPLTMNNGGAGAASGGTFNGSAAITISYNSIGATRAGAITAGDLTINTGKLAGRTTAAAGAVEEITPGATMTLAAGALGVAKVPNALTGNNGGAGAASGGTYDGSAAVTFSWNTFGAAPDTPRTQAAVAESITPTFSNDVVQRLSCAGAITLNNPTGTAIDNWGLVVKLRDNGTARAIGYGTQYRAIGVTLPITTIVNKILIMGFIFNTTDTTWDCVAVAQQ